MTVSDDVIRQLHARDPIAQQLGVELVDFTDSSVTLRLEIADRHVGWNDVCHGGVLFTLADIAMAYASNGDGVDAVATHAAIDFLDGVRRGDVVIARGDVAIRRARAAICDVTLSVDERVVGVFRGNTLRTARS